MEDSYQLNNEELSKYKKLLAHAESWAKKHQAAIGGAEIALGAALISTGLNTGAIEMGKDVVASLLDKSSISWGAIGAASLGPIGALAAGTIGSIGIAFGGTAIGIPAIVLAGGASIVLGAMGYAGGDLAQSLLAPSIEIGTLLKGSSLLSIGLALLIDGSRRILPENAIKKGLSQFKAGCLFLITATVEIIAKTKESLIDLYSKAIEKMELNGISSSDIAISTAGLAGGGILGGTIATGSVTVLGSSTLGGVGLTLGIVSAPIWPIIACGAGGTLVAYTAFKSFKKLFSGDDPVDLFVSDMLLLADDRSKLT